MKEDVNRFVEDLSHGDFIVFAGAGIVSETGVIASWKRLLEALKKEEPTVPLEDLQKIDERDYPSVAQKIFDALRQEGKEERYFEILKEELRPKITDYSANELDIVETARHVVTTNFDETFANAINRVLEGDENTPRVIQSLPELKTHVFSHQYSLSYLHGYVNERCVVFKTDDYEKFYPSQSGRSDTCDNLEKFLRHIYEERTIVFVGFSFKDNYFLRAIEKIYQNLKQNDVVGKATKPSYREVLSQMRHYALLPEEARRKVTEGDGFSTDHRKIELGEDALRMDDLEKRLSQININVLRYKEYREWVQWFKEVRDLQRTIGISSRGT